MTHCIQCIFAIGLLLHSAQAAKRSRPEGFDPGPEPKAVLQRTQASQLYTLCAQGTDATLERWLTQANPPIDASQKMVGWLWAIENQNASVVRYFFADSSLASHFKHTRGGNHGLLHAAVRVSEVAWVRKLIQWGVAPDGLNSRRETALWCAVNQNALECVRILLAVQANPNQANAQGITPLILAVYRGRLDLVQTLLDYGADTTRRIQVATCPPGGATEELSSFWVAVRQGRWEIARALYLHDPRCDCEDAEGRRILRIEAERSRPSRVRALCRFYQLILLDTPLAAFIQEMEKATTEIPLSSKPLGPTHPRHKIWSEIIDRPGADGLTPLMDRCRHGDVALVKILLEAGADPDRLDIYGYTALHYAARFDEKSSTEATNVSLAMIEELCWHHARIDPASHSGATPLSIAAFQGNVNAVLALIKAGSCSIPSALGFACQRGHHLLVKHLVDHAPAAYIIGPVLEEGVIAAAARRDLPTLRALIKAGADLDRLSTQGPTALMISAQLGFTEIVAELLEAGATVDSIDTNGQSALFLAVHKGHLSVVRQLLIAGASVHLRTHLGLKIMDLASLQSEPAIIEDLVQANADVNDGLSYSILIDHTVLSAGYNPLELTILASIKFGHSADKLRKFFGAVNRPKYQTIYQGLLLAEKYGKSEEMEILAQAQSYYAIHQAIKPSSREDLALVHAPQQAGHHGIDE